MKAPSTQAAPCQPARPQKSRYPAAQPTAAAQHRQPRKRVTRPTAAGCIRPHSCIPLRTIPPPKQAAPAESARSVGSSHTRAPPRFTRSSTVSIDPNIRKSCLSFVNFRPTAALRGGKAAFFTFRNGSKSQLLEYKSME